MKYKPIFPALILLLSIIFTACGSAGGSGVPVTGVSLNKSFTTIMTGSSEQLFAAITPSDADSKTVTWTSSNESVAAVSADGLVTGIARGTATITAAAGSASAACETRTLKWTHPSGLSDNISVNGEDAINPQVAMDDNGNAVIVWRQWMQAPIEGYQVFKSDYRGSWSHPGTATDYINPDNTGTTPYPQACMDNNGNTLILWPQSNDKIFISEYRNSTWDHPEGTDNFSGTSGIAHDPRVAMSDDGNAIVVWMELDVSEKIYMKAYENDAWQAASQINDQINPGTVYLPQVAMDNKGDAVIVWQQEPGLYSQIFMSEYRNGTWTNPQDSDDNISPDGKDAYAPTVAMDNNGNVIIVWRQDDGDYNRIFKSEYRGGEWTHPENLDDSISPDGTDAGDPRVVMDNNGNAVIVWEQDDGDNDSQVFVSEYRGGSWTMPSGLSDNISPDGSDARYPEAAMDDNGNAIIVWVQDADGANDFRIFKSEYRGGLWTHPSIDGYISPGGETDSYPMVSMDNTGNAIITWAQSDGSDYQIFISECR